MAAPVKLNFKMYQGGTFKEVLRRETSTKVYKAISGITRAAPCVITSAAHGLVAGWRAKVTNVSGMTDINSAETYHAVTDTTSDTITINDLNSLGFKDYVSGGVIEYNQPYDLTAVTARMQLRGKLTDTEVITELTTENGGIVIDTVLNTITIVVSASATAAFSFSTAVYSMELVSGTEVIPFITGTISLEKEVTR